MGEEQENKFASVYSDVATVPAVVSARVDVDDHGTVSVEAGLKIRDLARGHAVSALKHTTVELGRGDAVCSRRPVHPLPPNVLRAVSPSSRLTAFIHDPAAETRRLEVWSDAGLVLSLDLKDAPHGPIWSNSVLGGMVWSPDETRIAYVAEDERASDKSMPFFHPPKEGKDHKEVPRGHQFDYDDSLGESMKRIANPTVFVLDVAPAKSMPLRGVAGRLTKIVPPPGQCACATGSWHSSSEYFALTAFATSPQRLGLLYCQNRRSTICVAPLPRAQHKSEVVAIAACGDEMAWCPRFSPDGSKLAYLAQVHDVPHLSAAQLKIATWAPVEEEASRPLSTRVAVDVVETPTSKGAFPGLFLRSLPERCWLANDAIALSSQWGSDMVALVVDLAPEEAAVHRLSPVHASWTILDVCGTHCVASASTCLVSDQLRIGDLRDWAKGVQWTELRGFLPSVEVEGSMDVLSVEPSTNNKEHVFEAVLIAPPPPADGAKVPLVLFPHGGPHSAFTTGFTVPGAYFVRLGFAVLWVNYRGSLGFGTAPLLSLPGHVGRQDVDDMMDALAKALDTHKAMFSESRVAVCGGSHGGFLSLHLVGQHADRFFACAVRNPVCNVAGMVSETDIPDWCFAEATGARQEGPLNAEVLVRMFDSSPIAHAHKVRAPVLMMLGEDDLRVPNNQALFYCRQLRLGNNAPAVRVLSYPGTGHPLDKVDCEADQWLNVGLFFSAQLPPN